MVKLKSIWNDPVWSKVIATAIVAAVGLVITSLLDLWPAIGFGVSVALDFLGASTPVSNWLLGLFITCTLLVVLVIGAAIWQHIFPTQSVTWHRYSTDTFLGLSWHWQYGSDGGIYNLYCCCSQCQYQVFPENVSQYAMVPRIVFRCDICKTVIGPFEEHMQSIESRVTRLIQRKLRMDLWGDRAAS
jgi:hypothetical protein